MTTVEILAVLALGGGIVYYVESHLAVIRAALASAKAELAKVEAGAKAELAKLEVELKAALGKAKATVKADEAKVDETVKTDVAAAKTEAIDKIKTV